MKLLSNKEVINHKTEISNAIELAEEITICTAFLKYSGLKSLIELINQKKTKTIFFVGTNFYQTEPSALKQLFNDGHTIYLNREKSPTFHPKIFLFRNQNEVKVFIGSANLTSGGLETNIETSIECNTTIDSLLHNDILEQLNYFRTKSKRIEILETILDYEKRYKVYKEKHQIADKAFEKEEQKIVEAERKREEERLLKREKSWLLNLTKQEIDLQYLRTIRKAGQYFLKNLNNSKLKIMETLLYQNLTNYIIGIKNKGSFMVT